MDQSSSTYSTIDINKISYPQYTTTDCKKVCDHSDNEFATNNNYNGRWTKKEHEKFLLAYSKYGHNWRKVQTIVSTRTSVQIRSHAQKFFLRIKNKKFERLKPGIKKLKKPIMNIFKINKCLNKLPENVSSGLGLYEELKFYFNKIKSGKIRRASINDLCSNSFDLNFNFEIESIRNANIEDNEIRQIEYENIMYNNY
jgi:SHAQKYF class myb-like DNA-binding protein